MAGRLVAALAAAAIGVATVPASAQSPGSIADVPPGIERVLAGYADAFLERDAEGLESAVAPELLESERAALANAADVPFASYEIRISTQFSGDLASARIRSNYPGQTVATYHVIENTRIGEEALAYTEHGAFTFVRSEEGPDPFDGWRLRSKGDLETLGFFSPYHLWDEAPVSVVDSDSFVLLTHPDVLEEMRTVVDLAETALQTATEFWTDPGGDRFVIVAPSTTEELGRMLRTTLDLGNFVAFVAAGVDRSTGWEPSGPRLFVHLNNLRRYGGEARMQILAHELIHAVTRPASGPHIPIWVEEGLADLGAQTPRRGVDLGPPPDDFPTSDQFATGGVRDIQRAYDRAQVAFEVLDEQVGREGLVAFYRSLGSARVAPGRESYHIRRAIEAAGWSYDEWLEAWRAALG